MMRQLSVFCLDSGERRERGRMIREVEQEHDEEPENKGRRKEGKIGKKKNKRDIKC